MTSLRMLIIPAAIMATVVAHPVTLRASDLTAAPLAELSAKLQEAEHVLYELLLPNSMARTEPRSKQREEELLNRFKRISAAFKKEPDVSIRFLAAKVASTPPDEQDPALCALQLLYEINTASSRMVIREAQTHPNEVVSGLAKSMINDNQDALWGFRDKNGEP